MNRLVIPSILTATVLVAGLFALMPIEKASTVHSTIIQDVGRSTAKSVYVGAGATALNEVPIMTTGATGKEFRGRVMAMVTDSSQAGGAADVLVECSTFANIAATIDDDNAVDAGTAITTADAVDTVGEGETAPMEDADNCEVLTVDVAANTEAVISIEIDSVS